ASDSHAAEQAIHPRIRSGPAPLVLRERDVQNRQNESRQWQFHRIRYADAEQPADRDRTCGRWDAVVLRERRQQDRADHHVRRGHRISRSDRRRRTGRHRRGFSEAHVSRIGRITPGGAVTEFSKGLTPGCRPLSLVVRDGELWFSEYQAGQIGRISMDGRVTEYKIPTPNSEPRALAAHPDGHIW